jgi:hypothetical protein
LTLRLEGYVGMSAKPLHDLNSGDMAYAGDTWDTFPRSSPASTKRRCSAGLPLAVRGLARPVVAYHMEGVVAFSEY